MVLRSLSQKRRQNPWETSSKSELVPIGTHKLFISTSGPARTPGTPVIIYFTGGGVPVAAHVRLQAVLSTFARVYFYDRSGYDWSQVGPVEHPTADVAAAECYALLKAVQVSPPYILVGHSYGSIVAREFLDLYTDSVAGMVLADSATELLYEVFSEPLPGADMAAIAESIDVAKLTHLREESSLTDREWETAIEAIERTAPASNAEDCRGSGRPLARKRQFQMQALGHQPLSVIRCNTAHDYRIVYEAGIAAGNGTEEQRAGALKFIETWELYDDELRAAQLRLSSKCRYKHIADCGHDVAIRRPEVIAKEVRWVLEQLALSDMPHKMPERRATTGPADPLQPMLERRKTIHG